MDLLKKHKTLFRSGGICLLTIGSGWALYYTYKARRKQSIQPDVLHSKRKEPEYIYITDPRLEDEINLFASRYGEKEVEQILPWNWLASWKHLYPWRLLSVAQKGDKSDRLKAVRQLASLKNLADSDYTHIAQACDARTAIGLARSKDVDLRYFLKSNYLNIYRNKQDVIDGLKHLLTALDSKSNHLCMKYLVSKTLPDYYQRHQMFDSELSSVETSLRVVKDNELIHICIQNLLHHSAVGDNAKDIVALGGLQLLIGVYRYCSNNKEVVIPLAKLLSNISFYSEHLFEIFRTGWIGILARWAQDTDIRISAPAIKALYNLDEDVRDGIFPRSVYILHPSFRNRQMPKMDVVFIHGLLGGLFVTWRQRDSETKNIESKNIAVTKSKSPSYPHISDEKTKEYFKEVTEIKQEEWDEIGHDFEIVMDDCPLSTNMIGSGPYTSDNKHCPGDTETCNVYTPCWPRDWLASDCPKLRIIGVNYDTAISSWSPICPAQKLKCTLDDRSEEIMKKLKIAGVGKRPVIWVAHSMGGLLVKNMLTKDWESKEKSLCYNTKGIVFYSVPHLGSPLAELTQATQLLLWPSVEVQELRKDSPALVKLHNKFLNLLNEIPVEVISFAETRSTLVSPLRLQFNFVPVSSADPGIGEIFQIPQDHLCICKPASRNSFLYQKLLALIKKVEQAAT